MENLNLKFIFNNKKIMFLVYSLYYKLVQIVSYLQ